MTKLSRFFVIISTVLSLLTIVSCSALFGGDDSDDDVEYSADGKSYITINAKALSRTLMPTAKLADLTNIKLTGALDGVEKTEPLLKVGTYTDLSSAKVEIETGTWEFTLCANYGEVVLKGSTTQEIKSGTVTKLTFVLKGEASYGGLDIALKIKSGTADKVTATLMTADKSETVATKDLTLTDGEAAFTRSITSETERLASGTYYILFEFKYGSTVLNTSEHYVRIAKGFTTTSTIELDLNALYTITYKYYVNGELFEDVAEAGVSPARNTDVLSTKYSRKDEDITLPTMKKSGYQFVGWYSNETIEEVKEKIGKGSTGDITLYGCFINGITVNATSGKENPNIFVGEAADTIENAFIKINSMNLAELEWTVFIDGEVKKCPEVSDDLKAKSITFAGVTNNVTDSINGNEQGTVLLVSTSQIPVYIRNLKIMNGRGTAGGGIYIAEGATVTLEENALITGSTSQGGDSVGGGVYNRGTLIMKGGEISGNKGSGDQNSHYGGGVCNAGTFKMLGGTIKGNTCTNKGNGVYNVGIFEMSGSAVVASDNDVYLITDGESPAVTRKEGVNSAYITIADTLTGTGKVATITTQDSRTDKVLDGVAAVVEANYSKFALTAVDEENGGTWSINKKGEIAYSNIAEKIISVHFDGEDKKDLQIIIAGSKNLVGTLEEMGENDVVRTFGVNDGFTDITWSVDGENIGTGDSSVSGFSIEEGMLKAKKSNMVEGVYDITVTASKDGKTYSASFQLKK